MLTILKVSSLAYKFVFYRPENNTKVGEPQGTEDLEMSFGGLEMQKWNIATDRAQIVDEKNGSFL